MRSVVSVSMPPELATELKIESQEVGLTFSAYVCELVTRGRIPRSLSTPPARPDSPSEEMLAKAQELVHEAVEQGTSLWSKTSVEPTGTPAERVYSAITNVSRSVEDIAEDSGLSSEDALNEIDALINGDVPEPIMVKAIGGEWFCWRVDEG